MLGPGLPRERGDLGMPKHAIADYSQTILCCHLSNTNEESGGPATAIPPFAKITLVLVIITTTISHVSSRGKYSVPTGTDVLGDQKSVPESSEVRA